MKELILIQHILNNNKKEILIRITYWLSLIAGSAGKAWESWETL